MIIFITAHKNFAIESYEVNALRYMVEPVQRERFVIAGKRAMKYYSYKIQLNNMVYIEGVEDGRKIHRLNGKSIMTLITL